MASPLLVLGMFRTRKNAPLSGYGRSAPIG